MKLNLDFFCRLLLVCFSVGALSSCHSSKKSASEFHQSQIDGLETSLTHSDRHPKISKERNKIAAEARSWLGTPYAYAHAEKGVATDCSGMVLKVYETVIGITLPRNSAKQAEFCKGIKRKDIKVGDLVFFATGKDPDRISHVGIMLDDTNFIHASTSKGVVVSSVDQSYYIRTFKGFGRVPD